MYHKCIELLYKVISNDKIKNSLTLDVLFSFMSNNKNDIGDKAFLGIFNSKL